ncbi:Membrane protein of ER body-like protein [Raphanus sativus]|nr:Membrane protein of ER body-like protein [Raphanus sativus]
MDVTNSHDPSRGFNYGSTAEHGQQFPVREEDETSAVDRNKSPNKGRLTPMLSSLPLSTQQKMVNDDKKKPPKKGRLTPMRSPIPVSIPVALAEPLLTPVVEGREVEILKSIVYGGLAEAIASLGVISSAAGSGASTLNILVLGLANLFGGLVLIIHNLHELRKEEPIRETTAESQTNGQKESRYKRLLGRRENFMLHATVAILSFIITGLLPPVVYYFSFRETHNKDYKVASVFGASLICITLLALAKAHVRNPRSSYLKSVLYYATTSVAVSGITYVVGNVVNQLIEKYGWFDGSETQAGEMMLSLMGRKAGGFGYSSSY